MSIVVPKGRKYLCADALFRLLHENFACIADDGADDVEIPLDDALMSAFAMFSLKAPSLLSFDKQRVVFLQPAAKCKRPAWQPSPGQKGAAHQALMASQRPSAP